MRKIFMRMFGKVGQAVEPEPTVEESVEEPVLLLDDVDGVRAAVEEARAEAVGRRTAAEERVQAARVEAARIVADAEREANALSAEASSLDREAGRLEERLNYLTHAGQLRDRIGEADEETAALEAEAADVGEQVDALTVRLEELGVQRENATAALSAARDAGDVEGVQRQRAEQSAVDEVVKALTGRREALRGRLEAIGGPEHPRSEVAAVLGRREAARLELRRIENILDPGRTEAKVDELLAALNGAIAAQAAEAPVPQQQRMQVQSLPKESVVPVNKPTPNIDRLLKARAKTEDQVGVYDVNGNLIGICDPDAIVPLAQMDDLAKQAAAVAVFQQLRKRQH